MYKLIIIFFFFSIYSLFISSCSYDKSFAIIDIKCGGCHSPNIVYMEKRDDRQWDRIIYAMKL
ncbi:MAG: hypothetical protein SVN78_02675, partial [Deferribacterota bacterium]|nr:hypothetical protein [Deferribacterota bacterium]